MRVLIPVDGSVSSANAVDLFAERARRMSVKPDAELLNIQLPMPLRVLNQWGLEDVRKACEADGLKVLSRCARAVEEAGVKLEQRVLFGAAGETIAEESERFAADLIVMGARGATPAESFFLGSVSRSVLAHTRRPVLLARGCALPEKENMTIVLAADGSHYVTRATEFIITHPEFFGAAPSIKVVSVVPDYSDLEKAGPQDFEPLLRHARERREEENEKAWHEATDAVIERLRKAGFDAEGVKAAGDPAEQIALYANAHADLIVMGSHGLGRMKTAVLGSVAMKTGAFTHLPMLLIRIEK